MYSKRPSIILGFHSCDESVRDNLVNNRDVMKPSTNDYDWLGNGFYFWENNYARALSFAKEKKIWIEKEVLQGNKKPCDLINTPSVLGAYIDLGNCLDLLDSYYLTQLQGAYVQTKQSYYKSGLELPVNIPRYNRLDCAVIQMYAKNNPELDSVRGAFLEGEDLYPGAVIKEKNHIQICIRNIDCIKCFFIPRELKK